MDVRMQFKIDPLIVKEAVVLAQNIIKNKGSKVIRRNDIIAINKFIMKVNNSSTRMKITMRDCEKIVNIAKAYS